ncbi:MAG: lipocalin family protein [Crocinitomicaceae bacterium]|nr:lipocalin family protein [Crocinitomicaceae bacterium]
MKQLTIITLVILTTVLMTSCGNGNQKNQVTGEWTLSSFSNDGEVVELTDCDEKTTWSFTLEPAEALDDGTEVQKLKAVAPENCKYFGFDAKWTISDGKLFISTSRIGGMGGSSFAGLMEIKELTNNKMVVKTMKKELTFNR